MGRSASVDVYKHVSMSRSGTGVSTGDVTRGRMCANIYARSHGGTGVLEPALQEVIMRAFVKTMPA